MRELPPRAPAVDAGRRKASVDDSTEAGPTDELVESIMDGLEARGVPSGAWLLEIARVRRALHEADTLLRRLEEAVIRDSDLSRSADS